MTFPTLEGQTLGKYRILTALGRGGMAQVYRAYHPQLERQVAIKVLRADLAAQPQFLDRFRREARALAALRHPNIVQVLDFDAQDDLYYMVMELLEGDSLRDRLNASRIKGQRLPLPDALRITADVLSGLSAAHQTGIIHRDIKPANILLTQSGQAVLTDFGIAQMTGADPLTVAGTLMGTLTYMAPEQGLTGSADARSDLYALGIVLYEMLTGCPPFEADTPLAILMKHRNDPLPLPSHLDPHIPPALEAIVLKALAKDPADRYQTAVEMLSALQGVEVPAGPRPLAPAQSVFSGEARQHIPEGALSQGDTDPDVRLPAPRGAPDSPVSAAVMKGRGIGPISLLAAVFGGLSAALLLNMAAMMGQSAGAAGVFTRGWPFEVLLVAALLGLLAWALQNVWLLIPGIILFGSGLLLAFTALTGRWGDWLFLWMLLPILIFGAIALPLQAGRQPGRRQARARMGGALLGLAGLTLAALTMALAFLM